MKKKVTLSLATMLLSLMTYHTLYAQAPQEINYQAVIRDNLGSLIVNQEVDIRFTIDRGSNSIGSPYIEVHNNVLTNEFGLVTLKIGTGDISANSINFSSIDWSADRHFLQVEVDPDNSGFVDLGNTELVSVPYALYAETSGGSPQLNSLIDTIRAGSTLCSSGGIILRMGLDSNSNNVLDVNEMTSSIVICSDFSTSPSLSVSDSDWVIDATNTNIHRLLGNVGIGTSTPSKKLSIESDDASGDGLLINNTVGSSTIELQRQGASRFVLGVDQSDDKFKIGTRTTLANDSIFTIDNSGAVGIGTNNPTHRLAVSSSDAVIANFTSSSDSSILTLSNTNTNSTSGITLTNNNGSGTVALDSDKLLIENPIAGGSVEINATNNGTIEHTASNINNSATNNINNNADTIFNTTNVITSDAPSGNLTHINKGTFITDSTRIGSLAGPIGASPRATLDVEGSFRLKDGVNPVDNGYVLTAIDTDGNAEWKAGEQRVAFEVRPNTPTIMIGTAQTTLGLTDVLLNDGGNYDTINTFTAPVTGVYNLYAQSSIMVTTSATLTDIFMQIFNQSGGILLKETVTSVQSNETGTVSINTTVRLLKGAEISIRIFLGSPPITATADDDRTWFGGHLIYAD